MEISDNRLFKDISLNDCFDLCDTYMVQIEMDRMQVRIIWNHDGYIYSKRIDKASIVNSTIPFSQYIEDFVKHCKSEYNRVKDIDEWE